MRGEGRQEVRCSVTCCRSGGYATFGAAFEEIVKRPRN
jgi:hypothetical protein